MSATSWLVWFCGVETLVDSSKSPLKFVRVREVELSYMFGEPVLHCSCFYPKRFRRPCRHILSVLGVDHPSMHSPRWFKHYSYYGELDDPQFDSTVKASRQYIQYYDGYNTMVTFQ